MLDKAIALTAEKFVGKLDKSGVPYIMHCLHVMVDLHTEDQELMQIAVMHDLVEDTDITTMHLRSMGFSERVIDGVWCLTHKENVSYDDYIRSIATNPDAKQVKRADLRHNSLITRLKGLREKDHKRNEKYVRAYVYLSE